jgi:hypothetical protein
LVGLKFNSKLKAASIPQHIVPFKKHCNQLRNKHRKAERIIQSVYSGRVGASERSRKLTISAERQYFLSLLVDAAEIYGGSIRIGAFQA